MKKSYAILSTNLRRNNCWDRSKGTFKQHETHVTINAIERILTSYSIFAIVKHQEYLNVHQPSLIYCGHGGKMMRIV